MRNLSKAVVGILLGSVAGGCSSDYGPRYVQRVPVAGPGAPNTRPYEPERSGGFGVGGRELPPPESPVYNPTAAGQRLPEQSAFEQAYRAVGRPRIMVVASRSPDGGDAQAAAVDSTVIENALTDVLACQGAVEIVSPATVRQRLADAQARDGQANRLQAMRDVAQQLDTDVLVNVTAQPAGGAGAAVRLVGEAVNVKGGQQIGRAVEDVSPPPEKEALTRSTRAVARKLMADMTQNWTMAEPPAGAPGAPLNRPPAATAPGTK